MQRVSDAFLRLTDIMDELREKCPWDRKQTIHTLRSMTIEETYELADAITSEDWQHIKEELGDLLLHILFYSKIGAEQQQFTLQEVIDTISEKLITRHPHIYGDVKVESEDDVKRNWEKIKMKEGKTSVLSGVPVSLPSVVKATRIQEKVKQVGFEWENKQDVWKKVEEEMEELKEAETISLERTEEEFGDLLFSLVNYARFLQIDAETALEKTNKKKQNKREEH
jgi:MazG family protein